MREIPATWMRGGTSKCWVFEDDVLRSASVAGVDATLLRLFGSPDARQVDGIGGGTSTTSKAVILSPSSSSDADVDYTFAQVDVISVRVGENLYLDMPWPHDRFLDIYGAVAETRECLGLCGLERGL